MLLHIRYLFWSIAPNTLRLLLLSFLSASKRKHVSVFPCPLFFLDHLPDFFSLFTTKVSIILSNNNIKSVHNPYPTTDIFKEIYIYIYINLFILHLKNLMAQVANTRPVGRIQLSTLFYLAQHLVSTWWQH